MPRIELHLSELASKVRAGARTLLVSGTPFGVHTVYPAEVAVADGKVMAFAEDDCGNWIGRRGRAPEVLFVDHETNEVTVLADSIAEFVANLAEWKGPALEPGQVTRAWIDPDFLKKLQNGET